MRYPYPFWLSIKPPGLGSADEEEFLAKIRQKTLGVSNSQENSPILDTEEILMSPAPLSRQEAIRLLKNIPDESIEEASLTEVVDIYYAIFYSFLESLFHKRAFEREYLKTLTTLRDNLKKRLSLLYIKEGLETNMEEDAQLRIEACSGEAAVCLQSVLFSLILEETPFAGTALEFADMLVRANDYLQLVLREALLQRIHGYAKAKQTMFETKEPFHQKREKIRLNKRYYDIKNDIKLWRDFINNLEKLYPENEEAKKGFQILHIWYNEIVAAFFRAKSLGVDGKEKMPEDLSKEAKTSLLIRSATI